MRGIYCRGLGLLMLISQPLQAVDTGQQCCYDTRSEISCPRSGERFHGQDGNYSGAQPDYRDHGDGTVSDRVTGLMWTKVVEPHKVSLVEAKALAKRVRTGGHRDWRVPTIKELSR